MQLDLFEVLVYKGMCVYLRNGTTAWINDNFNHFLDNSDHYSKDNVTRTTLWRTEGDTKETY